MYLEINGTVDKFNSTGKGTYRLEVIVKKSPGAADTLDKLEKQQVTITAIEGDVESFSATDHPDQSEMDLGKYPMCIVDRDGALLVALDPPIGMIFVALRGISVAGVEVLAKEQMIEVAEIDHDRILSTDDISIPIISWDGLGWHPGHQPQAPPIYVDGEFKVELVPDMELVALADYMTIADDDDADEPEVEFPAGACLTLVGQNDEFIEVLYFKDQDSPAVTYELEKGFWPNLGWFAKQPDAGAETDDTETSDDDDDDDTPLNEDAPPVLSFEDVNKGDKLTNPNDWGIYPVGVVFDVTGIKKDDGIATLLETFKPDDAPWGDGEPFEVSSTDIENNFFKVE